MIKAQWQVLTTAPNHSTAYVLAKLVEGQGVPCQIESGSSLLGEAQDCALLVEGHQLHRARWILDQASFSDAELEFLATGHLSCEDAREHIAMPAHEKINYVEFPASDLERTKAFFATAFGWSFIDYGPEYTAFSNQGLDGGFYKSELKATTEGGSALIVLFSQSLEETLAKVKGAGGQIVRPIFPFPGGRRFHFIEPSGNEFAVWGEAGA